MNLEAIVEAGKANDMLMCSAWAGRDVPVRLIGVTHRQRAANEMPADPPRYLNPATAGVEWSARVYRYPAAPGVDATTSINV